jgi:hypothetical protein
MKRFVMALVAIAALSGSAQAAKYPWGDDEPFIPPVAVAAGTQASDYMAEHREDASFPIWDVSAHCHDKDCVASQYEFRRWAMQKWDDLDRLTRLECIHAVDAYGDYYVLMECIKGHDTLH